MCASHSFIIHNFTDQHNDRLLIGNDQLHVIQSDKKSQSVTPDWILHNNEIL